MLTPTELLEVVDTMQPIVDELNDWITRDIIRRMMARLDRGEEFTLTGTDEWQVEVFKAAGGHYEALQQEIKRFTKKSDKEVKEIFEDIGIRAWESDMDFYANYGFESVSLFQSESMLKLLEDTYRRTNGEIHNFTRTTAETSQQRLIKALDTAHFKVMSGAQSYTQAVKDAVNEIADTQATVRYPSGHIDTIETAVLRAVRTGAGQASGNMTMQGLIDRDWDLIRVSAHLGARYGDGGQNPSNHFWWQGKLYSRTGRTKEYPLFEEATGYGTGEGLCGYNCRHSFGPGDPNHNPYQDFDAEENKKVYDLSQKQRRAESRIRKSKSKLIALREAMDCSDNEEVKAAIQEEYNKEALKLSKYNAEYNKFCEDNGLKRLQDRINVAKWNRSEAAKARKVANNAKSVDKSNERGIIDNRKLAMGLRKPVDHILTDEEIKSIIIDAKEIDIDISILRFNKGNATGFSDARGKINIRGDILPDITSKIPRDRMSQRAVLAHEYYGHYLNHPSEYEVGDWRDEFRASYDAAVRTPNLTDEDRAYLMLDAYDRAKEAGQTVEYDEVARRIIYGF